MDKISFMRIQEIIKQMNCINEIYKNNKNQYLKNDKTNKIDILRMKLMNKMTFCHLDSAEVRKSKVHGKGVFATKDIKKDEIITFYPVDILQLPVNNEGSVCSFSDRYKSKYGKIINPNVEYYKYYCSDNVVIIGDPTFTNNNNYLGHMINDISTHDKTNKSIKAYNKIADSANCDFVEPDDDNLFLPVLANRDIRKDEELFVSYGPQYWQNIQ